MVKGDYKRQEITTGSGVEGSGRAREAIKEHHEWGQCWQHRELVCRDGRDVPKSQALAKARVMGGESRGAAVAKTPDSKM